MNAPDKIALDSIESRLALTREPFPASRKTYLSGALHPELRVPMRDKRTLHHDCKGRHGAGRVVLRAAPPGTGIIAGGPMRAVFDALGVRDVVAKSLGSSNPYNMVRATFDALKTQENPRAVAARRSKKVSEIVARRRDTAGEAAEAAQE